MLKSPRSQFKTKGWCCCTAVSWTRIPVDVCKDHIEKGKCVILTENVIACHNHRLIIGYTYRVEGSEYQGYMFINMSILKNEKNSVAFVYVVVV